MEEKGKYNITQANGLSTSAPMENTSTPASAGDCQVAVRLPLATLPGSVLPKPNTELLSKNGALSALFPDPEAALIWLHVQAEKLKGKEMSVFSGPATILYFPEPDGGMPQEHELAEGWYVVIRFAGECPWPGVTTFERERRKRG